MRLHSVSVSKPYFYYRLVDLSISLKHFSLLLALQSYKPFTTFQFGVLTPVIHCALIRKTRKFYSASFTMTVVQHYPTSKCKKTTYAITNNFLLYGLGNQAGSSQATIFCRHVAAHCACAEITRSSSNTARQCPESQRERWISHFQVWTLRPTLHPLFMKKLSSTMRMVRKLIYLTLTDQLNRLTLLSSDRQ